jgi:hypothetical protein
MVSSKRHGLAPAWHSRRNSLKPERLPIETPSGLSFNAGDIGSGAVASEGEARRRSGGDAMVRCEQEK